ncbi:hypothetical protein R5R35_013948 [Gryllus longicercus]|uniref:Uncharacterized protein n=1 Tax=Gryllus longicercus TaxID=2509291 RepID=A0AAN9V4J2_9ORTH
MKAPLDHAPASPVPLPLTHSPGQSLSLSTAQAHPFVSTTAAATHSVPELSPANSPPQMHAPPCPSPSPCDARALRGEATAGRRPLAPGLKPGPLQSGRQIKRMIEFSV